MLLYFHDKFSESSEFCAIDPSRLLAYALEVRETLHKSPNRNARLNTGQLQPYALMYPATETNMSVWRTQNVKLVRIFKLTRVAVRCTNHQANLGAARNKLVVKLDSLQQYASRTQNRTIKPDHFFDRLINEACIGSKSI